MSAAHVHPEDDHPHPTPVDMTWAAKANCMGVDASLFFAERGAAVQDPYAVCDACSCVEACLTHALTFPERFGIWGRHAPERREALRRDMNAGVPVEVVVRRALADPPKPPGRPKVKRTTQRRNRDMRLPASRTHGIQATYNAGCRCDDCTDAATEARRLRREGGAA